LEKNEILLKLNNIDVAYKRVIHVLRNVTLEVPRGNIVALLGPNGAGKTTVLKTISGLLKTEEGEVIKGDVIFEGVVINNLPPDEISNMGIAQVMEGRRVLEHLTVEENLLVGAYSRKDKASIKSDLEMVYQWFPKLKDMRKRVSGYLSGGEQQMLVIGRALMARPKLMLLDEPSLGLAPLVVREIYEIIYRINKEMGMSMLLVEQNAKMALEVAHYGYILENGRIVMEGKSDVLKDSEMIKDFYLGISASNRISYKKLKRANQAWML